MPAQLIRPDSVIQTIANSKTVFLAGTIDNGNSEDWQQATFDYLQDTAVTFMNPRREHWHPDTEQTISNPEFNHQVNWELNNIRDADIIFCFIGANSKSPITLMELGWLSGHNQYSTPIPTIIVCEPKFWRKGNVEILASRTPNFFLYSDMNSGLTHLRKKLNNV